jgi:hypothetical protein
VPDSPHREQESTLGTFAVTVTERGVRGTRRFVKGTIAAGGTYNNTGTAGTTGDTLKKADLGLSEVTTLIIRDSAGYAFEVLGTPTAGADPRVRVRQGDNANASPGPEIEVPNATNLTAAITAATFDAEGF